MTGNLALRRCAQCWKDKPLAAFIGKRGKLITWCSTCRDRRGPGGAYTLAPRRLDLPTRGALRVTFKLDSQNRKLGGIPCSITSAETCPPTCGLYGKGCYAEFSYLRSHWARTSSEGLSWRAFCREVAALPEGQLWRHNEAGDLPGRGVRITGMLLDDLVRANKGRRGFTFTHYPVLPDVMATLSRRGLSLVLGSPELQASFWSKVDRNGPTVRPGLGPCAVWTAARHSHRGNYGAFGVRVDGRAVSLKAHQVGFVLKHGRLPNEQVIRHECDTPLCVVHVAEGTHADNVTDKMARNRIPRGAQHHASKLSDDQVETIRVRRAAGETGQSLTKAFGVSAATVSMICTGTRRGPARLAAVDVRLANRELIRRANAGGFTVNLSADSLEQADQLYELGVGPVAVVLRSDAPERTETPAGRTVITCLAETRGLTCASCQLCAVRDRKSIVGFRAHGQLKRSVDQLVELRRSA